MEKLNPSSRVAEVSALTFSILEVYQSSNLSTDANLTSVMNGIISLREALNDAIKRMKDPSELEEKDTIRKVAGRGFGYLLKGNTYSTDPVVKAAALKVFAIFENYGFSIFYESYGVETGYIDSLLTDLAAENLQADIAAIPDCANLIAALTTAENDFKIAEAAYDEQRATEGTFANATELKLQLVKEINDKLVNYLIAMAQVNQEVYGHFAGAVDEIIHKYNVIVKHRGKEN